MPRQVACRALEGLGRAEKSSGVPWQHYQFHLLQNAMTYVPKI